MWERRVKVTDGRPGRGERNDIYYPWFLEGGKSEATRERACKRSVGTDANRITSATMMHLFCKTLSRVTDRSDPPFNQPNVVPVFSIKWRPNLCLFLKKKSEPTAFSSSAWVHFSRLNANVHNYNTGHVYARLMLHSGFCQFCIKEHSYRTVISKLYFGLLLGRITNQRLRTRLLNQTVTLSQHSALFTYDFLPLSPLLGVHIS